jgi:hypothetical protein
MNLTDEAGCVTASRTCTTIEQASSSGHRCDPGPRLWRSGCGDAAPEQRGWQGVRPCSLSAVYVQPVSPGDLNTLWDQSVKQCLFKVTARP